MFSQFFSPVNRFSRSTNQKRHRRNCKWSLKYVAGIISNVIVDDFGFGQISDNLFLAILKPRCTSSHLQSNTPNLSLCSARSARLVARKLKWVRRNVGKSKNQLVTGKAKAIAGVIYKIVRMPESCQSKVYKNPKPGILAPKPTNLLIIVAATEK